MMIKAKLCLALVILVTVAMIFGACSETVVAPPVVAPPVSSPPVSGPPVGGPCTYVDIPGIARVTSVEKAPSGEYNCADAVQVTFDFIPTDPAAVGHYRYPGWKDTGNHFTLGAGMNPPKTWVLERGLTAGSEHACVRSESTAGACAPVGFSFPKINMDGWEKYCFEK